MASGYTGIRAGVMLPGTKCRYIDDAGKNNHFFSPTSAYGGKKQLCEALNMVVFYRFTREERLCRSPTRVHRGGGLLARIFVAVIAASLKKWYGIFLLTL